MTPKLSTADKAWAGMWMYVLSYDLYAIASGKETMTAAAHRTIKHPIQRFFAWGWLAIIIKHLFFPKLLPKCDIINVVANVIYKRFANV